MFGESGGWLPPHALSRAVAQEVDQRVLLIAIQALDRVQEPSLRVLVRMRGERVKDPGRPTFLLEYRQDCFLVGAGV